MPRLGDSYQKQKDAANHLTFGIISSNMRACIEAMVPGPNLDLITGAKAGASQKKNGFITGPSGDIKRVMEHIRLEEVL